MPGCGDDTKSNDKNKAAAIKKKPAPPSPPEPSEDDGASRPETPDEPERPDPPPPAEVDPDAKPEREWLVWWRTEQGFTTRWVGDVGRRTATVAERGVLVHAAAGELFLVERKDVAATVKTCACFGEEFGPPDDCVTQGTLAQPGLMVTEIMSGKTRTLHAPDPEDIFGEVYDRSLRIGGGAQGLLFVETTDSGYYCGAHQLVEGSTAFIDLADPDSKVASKVELPQAVRVAAARGEMYKLYRQCTEEDPGLKKFAAGIAWTDLKMRLEGGVPRLTWGFEEEVYYVCSPDYATYGEATTGLIAEAEPLGLSGPMPDGLARALATLGTQYPVGWSELKLDAKQRDDVLAKFQSLEEKPWPPESSETVEAKPAAGTATGPAATVKAQLQAGRKLTRAGEYKRAIAAFDAAIAGDATKHRPWAGRGYAKLLDGQLEAAEKDCLHALTLNDKPGFQASVHYNLGLIGDKQGKKEKAREHFTKSVELRPNEEVQKALDALGPPPQPAADEAGEAGEAPKPE